MSDQAIQTLLQRLEQVASRLESVEKQLAKGGSAPAPAAGGSSGGASAGSASAVSSASVTEFDALVEQHLKPFIVGANSFGDSHLQKIVGLLENLVKTQRQFLQVAASSKKPSDADAQALWQAGSKIQQEITALRESKEARASKQFNHLSAISEGSPAFHWVLVAPTPGPFVADSRAASDFYANRILKEFKGVDQKQVDWINHWSNFLKELQNYVKQHHTTGVSWNAQGGAAPKDLGAGAAPAAHPAPPKGGPPPAGPPPAGPPPATGSTPGGGAPVGAALFAQINQGTGISSGLKHVTKDMKTKNLPAEQRSSVVKADDAPSKKATTSSTTKAPAVTKPPRVELEGTKWTVEYVKDNHNLKIMETEPRHTIYCFKCENSVIQINPEAKINGVVLDGCKKVQVVFHTAIANVEVINSSSIKVQCLGTVPNWAIDKCSDVTVYLSKEGMATQLVTSKSDAMNIVFPNEKPDADPYELALPEQFITRIVNGKLVTEQVRHE